MPFQPEKITREHVLEAAKIIDSGEYEISKSTKFDVVIVDKHYPPKDIMRLAHEQATGEFMWPPGGGEPTNKYLQALGFKIIEKNMESDPWLKFISDYKSIVSKNGNIEEIYKWKLIKENNPKMDFSSGDIEKSIKSIKFQNLVFKHGIAVLYNLAHNFPEELRNCFRQLFDEGVSIDIRVSNFIDQTLKIYRKKEPKLNHHQDERSIATYLTYKYPLKYTFYKDSFYQELCKKVGETPQKAGGKYIHYLKLVREFIRKYVSKDQELLEMKTNFLNNDCFSDENNMILAQDILYQVLSKGDSENEQEESEEITAPKLTNNMKTSLNTILFGPPGTGKTYGTMEYAVQIIENLNKVEITEKYKTREELRAKYLNYVTDKQIVFTTFHQSFSYEDFIEGIKPVMSNDSISVENEIYNNIIDFGSDVNNGLRYEIQPGIFKLIADEARTYEKFISKGIVWKRRPTEKELTNVQFFKMSLGNTLDEEDDKIFEYCIKNGCIALGYGNDIDFTGVTKRADIVTKYRENQIELKDKNDFRVSAVERFAIWMKEGDIVLISLGNHKLRAVGKIAGDGYYYNPNSGTGYNQYRNVEWLMVGQEVPVAEVYQKTFSQQAIYALFDSKIKKEFFIGSSKAKENETYKKNHVLIIDEINRGNVSQIFGELITLIEEDKRMGMDEALEVTLPYSKQRFTVPPNLYILGTMNTADRSVEALDTALRRRFSFEEIAPKPELLTPLETLRRFWLNAGEYSGSEAIYESHENEIRKLLGMRILDTKKYISYGNDEMSNFSYDQEEFALKLKDLLEFDGINLSIILSTINKRIEKLLNRDHQIGHSFFMTVYTLEGLKHAFQNKIIPLLQEYFYGDYGKIGLVLGEGFFENLEDESVKNIFAKFVDYDSSNLEEKAIYRLKNVGKMKDEEFNDAIKGLYNIGN